MDRDAQSSYLNAQATAHLDSSEPVISVDTKKKELVGSYKNNGAECRPAGDPDPVKVHDFIDPKLGRANHDGVYDVAADQGWVSVGTDHDTSAFAVNTIRSWWQGTGRHTYPEATRLLITADGGGSSGYRTRLWKTELAALATYPNTKVHDTEMKSLETSGTLTRHDWHGEWKPSTPQMRVLMTDGS